ncbi:MAG TPA: LytTR family DNA-binding domain-containing protein [Gemmatimonadaceae bacterium]|nr:LytTR family DNA-binding domain-containing protein [Gemmatimonadaceae bacterium]
MPIVRVLITDDEPAGRAGVRALLANDPRVEVVAECATGPETVRAVADHHPDLLFLDVQLPGQSGIAALSELPESMRPVVIFVTAFDVHALRAFDFEAADYLLKPYSDARFRKALDRGIARLDRGRVTDLRRQLLEIAEGLGDDDGRALRPPVGRLAVRIGDGVRLLDLDDILWIEAVRDYARVHTRTGEYLLRTTMSALEERLDPRRFVRIHRSTISNIAFVAELHAAERGESDVVLKTGKRLRASERGRRVLMRALQVDA